MSQLRAFVERIERPSDRLDYALARVQRCLGISAYVTNRAFRLAAEVLSTDFQTGRYVVQAAMVRRDAAPMDLIGPMDDQRVGYVYWAAADGEPDFVKIGFTRDVARREKQLTRIYSKPIRIFRRSVGTMLDEHDAHCARRAARVVGEWFRAEAA